MEFSEVASVKPVEMRPGILRRTLVHKDRMLLVHWQIRKAVRFGEHEHPYEQAGYMLKGAMELIVAGEKHLLRPGSAYVVASGVRHDAFVLEDCEILDVFSPVRSEYVVPSP
jgi:quercetin dioxygenase-like cupin family protein